MHYFVPNGVYFTKGALNLMFYQWNQSSNSLEKLRAQKNKGINRHLSFIIIHVIFVALSEEVLYKSGCKNNCIL